MIQGALPLPHRTAFGRADFLVSDCNRGALDWIERWPDWPGRALVLYGPRQSGRTHLARLWCGRAGGDIVEGASLAALDPVRLAGAKPRAIAVDDADRAPEDALLHLYNACRETGGSVLIIGREAPSAWPFALADLASRLRAVPALGISAPDDALLGGVLVKHFADRQLRVAPGVIAYLLPRMERSFAAAARLAERLDRLALSRGGPVRISLARSALAESDQSSSDLAVT
jgi:chromosomal replication initiation ATPase DnaA